VTVVGVPLTAYTNKWKQNLNSTSSTSATSLGTGNNGTLGTDIAYPIQLSATRWLWLFGDSWWPTAAGQQRLGCKLVGNIVALQVGADFSTSTVTYHAGPRPPRSAGVAASNTDPWPFFEFGPQRGTVALDAVGSPAGVRYPMAGARLDNQTVLIVGMSHHDNHLYAPGSGWTGEGGAAGTSPIGPFATLLIGDIDGTSPSTWRHFECSVDLPFTKSGINQRMGFHFGPGCEVRDGWVYIWCMGPWDQTGHWSVVRYPLEEVLLGRLRGGFWWAGGDRWVPDRSNAQRRIRVTPDVVRSEQGGAVRRRPDGRYQMTVVPEPFFDPAALAANRRQGPRTLRYGITNSPGGEFDSQHAFDIQDVVSDYDFVYSAYIVPGQSFFGITTEQILTLSRHNSGPSPDSNPFNAPAFSNTLTYWPEFYAVGGMN
jgi:hypothetical protein